MSTLCLGKGLPPFILHIKVPGAPTSTRNARISLAQPLPSGADWGEGWVSRQYTRVMKAKRAGGEGQKNFPKEVSELGLGEQNGVSKRNFRLHSRHWERHVWGH